MLEPEPKNLDTWNRIARCVL